MSLSFVFDKREKKFYKAGFSWNLLICFCTKVISLISRKTKSFKSSFLLFTIYGNLISRNHEFGNEDWYSSFLPAFVICGKRDFPFLHCLFWGLCSSFFSLLLFSEFHEILFRWNTMVRNLYLGHSVNHHPQISRKCVLMIWEIWK